ncbi:hypothetical protein D3C73_959380 [compost metagenome]
MMAITTGAKFCRNAAKVSSFTALPIMMFGGSPIKVAVPPIFDARTRENIYGKVFTFNCLVTLNTTGIMRIIVVTLSKKADAIAVIKANSHSMVTGLPLAFLAVHIPI